VKVQEVKRRWRNLADFSTGRGIGGVEVELRAREDEGAKGVSFGERGEAGIELTARSLQVD